MTPFLCITDSLNDPEFVPIINYDDYYYDKAFCM